jgi:hypothetical protein
MTARLLDELQNAGHTVSVGVGDGNGAWEWRGIPVSGSALNDPKAAQVIIVHAGRSWPGVEYRAKTGAALVMICHNTSPAVLDDLNGAKPDVVVVNSQSMAAELGVSALIINPPAPPPGTAMVGGSVATLSVNALKGGRQFWELARLMPEVPFLGVQGGYGSQIVQSVDNVHLIKHVHHEDLDEMVWARASVFLQLSEYESWGMAAAEAIAHGIPVVAHPTPGVVENLGDAAIYVDRDDIDALSAAVYRILNDPTPYRAAALARALEHRATSEVQMTTWVTAIERLGDATYQRDRSTEGALVRH